ncbi:unnamed protein product [Ectocarpus sp. CCAP 1310/34]|nr:unnamed protein product [Ectocarpus sp. CCAP 1310/34]
MSGRNDGGDSSNDSAAEDRKRSREELVALRTQVSSLTDQMSQLMSLVEDTTEASKKEEPAGTMEGAADRGDARESAAVESTNAEGGAPWTGSAQDGRYLREPVRESGPSGRHSGEAGGFVPQEVRLAAAHNQDYCSAMGDGGAAVGFGYGATTPATGYQSVRYTSPFRKKSKDFNEWLNDFRMAANGVNLLEQFKESGSLEIPVNSGKSKFSLSQQYRSELELAFHAWSFLSHALKDKDRTIMKRAETPQGALRELKTIHDPKSSAQPSEDLKSLTSTKISRGGNPQNALNEMLHTAKSSTEKGLTVSETFVLHLFLDALLDEYAMTKHNLRHAELTRTGLTRTGVLKEVMIEYKAIKDKREQGKGKGVKGAEQAYFADGEGRRERYSSRSQGQGRGRGGGRGRSSSRDRGGGGRGGGDGGRGGRSGGSGGVEESKGSSSGGADGGGGGDYKFPGRCFRCGHRGHQAIGCTTNEKDFVPWCASCEGWGHTKEKCPTEEAVLAQVVEHESDVDSVEDQAFCAVAVPPGECGTVGEVGLVGVVKQGQAVYVADTAATCSMFRCTDNFVNYREHSGWVKGIGGDKAPVPLLGYGDVTLVLQTEDGGVPVPVRNAAHVPEAPYNLLSLSSLVEEGHTCSEMKGGLTLTTKAGGEVWSPRTGKRLTQRGYQIKTTLHTACAALIVPGDAKAATPTDLNEYHLAHGHAHEKLLRITAEQQGVQLTHGPLLPCIGCSMSKGQPVTAQSTSEAEYMAAGEGVKEALFVRGVLSFIAPETSGAKIKVLEDNKGALAFIENPFSSARSKHIDVRFHFIRELSKSGKITAEKRCAGASPVAGA